MQSHAGFRNMNETGSGPGLKTAGDAMLAMREWLHADALMATFTINGDEIDMVAGENGIEMIVDGETVPMKGRPA